MLSLFRECWGWVTRRTVLTGRVRHRLGTNRAAAGTPENFEKIDREYVLNAARAAKTEGDHPQRLVYVSVSLHVLVPLILPRVTNMYRLHRSQHQTPHPETCI